MIYYVHYVNNKVCCDVNVAIKIDLPEKPGIGDLILLTQQQMTELIDLARRFNYKNIPNNTPINQVNTVSSVLFKCSDNSMHLEVLPLHDKQQ